MKNAFNDDLELMCRKGIYPYEWVDDIEKLQYNGLPELRDFYSTLKLQGVSESEYEHAWNVSQQAEM